MYLTIDIGGTKTLLARMNNQGKVEDSIKFPTPGEYKDFKKLLEENIVKITTSKWSLACVAAPGLIDREAGVAKSFGNLSWQNVPIKRDVRSVVDCEVLIENDAKLAALSEARFLNPRKNRVTYLTVSTGIGSGTIINNVLDPDLVDAEVGKMIFEKDGKLVTWESFASGKAIVKRFGKLASEINDLHIWRIIAKDLAIGIVDIAANVYPDVIIIGGGVGSHFQKYGELLRNEVKKYDNPLVKMPRIVGAKHPEQAVIYGCYEYIKDYEKSLKKT